MLDGSPNPVGRAVSAKGQACPIRARRTLPADLRRTIAAIEMSGGKGAGPCLSTGIAEIDAVLPGNGLALAAVHEVQGPSAADFALRLMVSGLSGNGSILWCVPEGRRDHLYGPGLWQARIDPHRLVVAVCRDREEMLWTVEEALKSGAVAAVVAQMEKDRGRRTRAIGRPVDLTASRRLQLAAEAGGGLGLILSEGENPGGGAVTPSAAATRWWIDPAPLHDPRDRACWAASLLRVRGGAVPDTVWRVRVDRDGSSSASILRKGRMAG